MQGKANAASPQLNAFISAAKRVLNCQNNFFYMNKVYCFASWVRGWRPNRALNKMNVCNKKEQFTEYKNNKNIIYLYNIIFLPLV